MTECQRVAVAFTLRHADPAGQRWFQHRIAAMARKYHHTLVRTVDIGPRMDRPTGRLLDAIDALLVGAAARGEPRPTILVITPDLDHIDGTRAVICAVADLLTVTPERVWRREQHPSFPVAVDR
ncbi:hypothetical protein [Nocardia suismassiliense]|uniref:hypothetical protein n=1 Tax=Nocardia suismassiliense TaxID=2077092 RepID=UPI000D1E9F80|nr:hypothetical protein [Nocardia suismassiliense]